MKNINPLDYPICLAQPLRLNYSSAWIEHVPFGMFMVDVLHPKVLVELGTHTGVSFSAFCQAVKQLGLDTRCYAVDTWEGDIQTGFYGVDVLADLRAHHDPLYGDFSRLVQSTFDEAFKYFSDGSIDLLHIDGLHTYEAVKHDFETWLPKLSKCGVIFFHDINVRERDFGVWRFWEEISAKYPSFSMTHGHGLGILVVGKEYSRVLNSILGMRENEIVKFRELFYLLGRQLEVQLEKEQSVQALTAQLAETQTQLTVIQAQLLKLQLEKEQSVQVLTAQLAETQTQLTVIQVQLSEQSQRYQGVITKKESQNDKNVNSKASRIAPLSRRIRVLLAPSNSRRAQLLRFLIVPIIKVRMDRKLKNDLMLMRSSSLFDEAWYLTKNPDVALAKIDPMRHYLLFGGLEGRDPSLHFCSAWYLTRYEDVNKAGINPLVHYLKYGKKEGRTIEPVPQFLTASGTIEIVQNKRANDTAVVLHLFYEDLFDEIKNYLQNLINFDLYISMHQSNSSLKDRIFESFPNAKILFIENRGRDILPFISIYKNISLLNYKYLLKIHTKKSPHIEDGSNWRNDIYRKLLGSTKIINSAMLALETNPAIGVIGPKGHVIDYRFYWNNNKEKTKELSNRVGISFRDNEPFNFIAGTMFWAKPDALRFLSLLSIDLQEFEPEPIGQDGALVHALERFIGLTVKKAGYSTYQIDDQGEVSDPKTNSSTDLYPLYLGESIRIFGEGNTTQPYNSDKFNINDIAMNNEDDLNSYVHELAESEIILPERRISKIIGRPTKVSVVIPTKNAGPLFRETLDKLKNQEYDGTIELIVIDSGSTDDTIALAGQYGALVTTISPEEFDHGLTRNRGIEIASGDIIVLMSQDAIPGNQHLIHNLVTAFDDPKVAGAFTRQEPREDADVLTKRNLKNWITGQNKEDVRCITDTIAYYNLSPMERFYFCSFDNVCSAIRKNVWETLPFKKNEFGEDIEWAQDALEAGWKIAYWPTAYVIHSHQRSYKYEYGRTYLCHKKLYRQFGIHSIPSRKHVILSTVNSIKEDWGYALKNEKRPGALSKLLVEIPALSFASVYGQYSGAHSWMERPQNTPKKSDGEKLRIILTVHQFVPDFSSGTEILTFETAKELKKLGHNVSVFTGYPAQGNIKDANRFDQYSIEGINVVRFYHNYLPMGNQSNPIEMDYCNNLVGSFFTNYLRHEKPDLVHFFHLMRLSASTVDACHELGISTVFTPTDFWFICPTGQLRLPNNQNCCGPDKSSVNCFRHIAINNHSEKIKALVRRLPDWVLAVLIFFIKHGINIDTKYSPLIRALSNRREFLIKRINRINKVITPTRIMHSMLTKNGLENHRTISIPFGINLSYLQNIERRKPGNVLRLGYIGTLAEYKGVHVLLEAMKKLALRPIELRIYGKLDDYPEYIEKLRKSSQDDPRIQFCGTFPNREIGRVFSELDALVVPSLWFENSPLVVYSAQAARCPVIASNMDGMSEIIEHGKNGLLFEAGNSIQLAAAIDSLLNDKNLLQELSTNSKMPLSIQEYTEKLVVIYRDLVKSEKTV